MCKLIVGINKCKTQNSKEFEQMITIQYPEIRKEPHGIGAVIITKDNKLHIFREYTHYDKVFDKVSDFLKDAKFVALHSRTSTGGVNDITNVHFFEHGDYLMAHNGWVPKYANHQLGFGMSSYYEDNFTLDNEDDKKCKSLITGSVVLNPIEQIKAKPKHKGYKLEKFCDSFLFLKNLPENVNVKTLEKHVEETRFIGFAVIINKKTHEVFLIVKKDVKCIYDDKTFSVLFSYEPELEMTYVNYKNVFGIEVTDEEEVVEIKRDVHEVTENIYQLEI